MSRRSTMELHLAPPVIRTVVIAMSALDKRTYSGRVEKCAMLLAQWVHYKGSIRGPIAP